MADRAADRFALLLVFATALTFYILTLAPTVTWADSASLATGAFAGPIEFGTAGHHPFFLLVARPFTWLPGDVAGHVNLVSALFGALTVMLVFRCARQVGAGVAAAAIGAAALCVSHAFWFHAVIAEVYTANAFFLAATFTLLLDWHRTGRVAWLVAAGAVFALGLTNHLVLGTALPATMLFVWLNADRTLRRWIIWTAVGAVAIAAAAALVGPASVLRTVRHLWYGPPGVSDYFDLRVDAKATAVEAAYYAGFLAYQFPSVSILLGGLGIAALWRRDRSVAALLLVAWAVNATVFVRHTVWPSANSMKFVFYIPDYVVFAMLCALGAEATLRFTRSRTGRRSAASILLLASVALLPPLVYANVPAAVSRFGIRWATVRPLPYRDTARFFLNPNKRGEEGARRFGEEVFSVAEPRAVIFADYTPFAVLQYLQKVEGRRPDLLLKTSVPNDQVVRVRPVLDENGHARRVYVVGTAADYYDLSAVGAPLEVVPVGPVFAVRTRGGTPTAVD